MHIFTCVQVLGLCALWLVKSSSFSLALPFVLLMMVPLKQKLATYYSATEMAAVSQRLVLLVMFCYMLKKNFSKQLDGSLPEVDIKDEPDFYEQSHLPV